MPGQLKRARATTTSADRTLRPRTHRQSIASQTQTRRKNRKRPSPAAPAAGRRKTRASSGEIVGGEVDPERILRKGGRPRTQQTKREPQALIPPGPSEAGQLADTSQTRSDVNSLGSLADIGNIIEHTIENTIEGSIGQGVSEDSGSPYENSLEIFYRRVGYLAPLSSAALDLLELILPDPGLIARMARFSASRNIKEFQRGLDYRNVALSPSQGTDAHLEEIKSLPFKIDEEDPAEKIYNDRLWNLDRGKCTHHSQEPTFQRTVLISMIDRYRLIYGKGEPGTTMLDFAVESTWECPPMPTMAARKLESFLTQPKPDLAIAFRRQSLFPGGTNWRMFPTATQRLVCYESIDPPHSDRAFHFLTVEAKKSSVSVYDDVARAQSLNNASQALHNMYEFFREADDGKGEKFINLFFDKVRFFSVIATSVGIGIRIHRACRISSNPASAGGSKSDYDLPGLDDPIREDYPLKFLYEDYWTAYSPLKRQDVVAVFTQILYGYGVGELAGHLREAILEVDRKFKKYEKDTGSCFPRDETYYSHGQLPPASRAASQQIRTQSYATSTNASFSQFHNWSEASSFAYNAASQQLESQSHGGLLALQRAGRSRKRARKG